MTVKIASASSVPHPAAGMSTRSNSVRSVRSWFHQTSLESTASTDSDIQKVDHYAETEKERAAIAAMMGGITEEEKKAFPDKFMPLRHLRADKGHSGIATVKLKATLAWRSQFGVKKILGCMDEGGDPETAAIVRDENATSKIYVRGYDKDGRAILYMRPVKENTSDMVKQMKHLVWNLEKAIACSAKNGRSKVCIVIDYEGFRLKHAPPLATARYTLDILQNHYPERMYRAYVCNPPFVFKAFWRLVQPFIDPTTKQKIVFLHGAKGMARIAEDVGPKNGPRYLEACAGGKGNIRPVESREYLGLPFDITFDEPKPLKQKSKSKTVNSDAKVSSATSEKEIPKKAPQTETVVKAPQLKNGLSKKIPETATSKAEPAHETTTPKLVKAAVPQMVSTKEAPREEPEKANPKKETEKPIEPLENDFAVAESKAESPKEESEKISAKEVLHESTVVEPKEETSNEESEKETPKEMVKNESMMVNPKKMTQQYFHEIKST